jgi:hypothetical protein
MVDKVTAPFQLRSGRWVAAGRIARAIAGDQSVFANAAVFGSEATDSPVALVWPASEYAGASKRALLRLVHSQLRRSNRTIEHWERPAAVVVADERWEFAPRAKVRAQLVARFGSALNAALPGTVPEALPAVNIAAERTARLAATLRRAMSGVLSGRGMGVIDALLACVDGGCLLRNANGTLRDPELRAAPYDPSAPLAARRRRFDDEPWHLWDMRLEESQKERSDALLRLHAARDRLVDVLPPMLPSLGALHKFGIRFQLRLACAAAVAARRPALLSGGSSAEVYADVMATCRPEWGAPGTPRAAAAASFCEKMGGLCSSADCRDCKHM